MAHKTETTLESVDKGLAPGFILEQVWELGKPCFFPLLLNVDNNELFSQGDCEKVTIEIICTILGSSQDKGAMSIGQELPGLSTKSLTPRRPPGTFSPRQMDTAVYATEPSILVSSSPSAALSWGPMSSPTAISSFETFPGHPRAPWLLS